MINIKQFRQFILTPAMDAIQLYSANAEELLCFTCAVESNGGEFIVQENGPALGIFQMEPNTFTDLFQNFIYKRAALLNLLALNLACPQLPRADRMIYDLKFAAAMARLFYERCPGSLPEATDVDGMWDYYKQFYNTPKGAAKKAQSIKAYQAFIGTSS